MNQAYLYPTFLLTLLAFKGTITVIASKPPLKTQGACKQYKYIIQTKVPGIARRILKKLKYDFEKKVLKELL